MVVTRSESARPTDSLSKTKRTSLGSLNSLNDKCHTTNGTHSSIIETERRKTSYHKSSQSLDLDLDIVSNECSFGFSLSFFL